MTLRNFLEDRREANDIAYSFGTWLLIAAFIRSIFMVVETKELWYKSVSLGWPNVGKLDLLMVQDFFFLTVIGIGCLCMLTYRDG